MTSSRVVLTFKAVPLTTSAAPPPPSPTSPLIPSGPETQLALPPTTLANAVQSFTDSPQTVSFPELSGFRRETLVRTPRPYSSEVSLGRDTPQSNPARQR
jgi:hypothetical protein